MAAGASFDFVDVGVAARSQEIADPMTTPTILTQYLRYVQFWWAVPVAIVLGITAWLLVLRSVRTRKKRLAELGTNEMVKRLTPHSMKVSAFWRPLRLGLAVLLMGIALAGPRWGIEGNVVRQSGIDIVLAVDASTSMMATDVSPNRLTALKRDVRNLRNRSPGDRFGLIAFAGKSYVLTPVTVDRRAVDLFMDNLDPNTVGQSGSSISSAIRQGIALLSLSKVEGDKALILFSDGESFEEAKEVEEAAKRAKQKGISLITVGYGSEQGSTIPINDKGVITEKRDQSGAVVVTKYNPEFLQLAANTAGGVFIPASDNQKAAHIRDALNKLRVTTRRAASDKNLAPQFQLFLIPAVLLLLLDALLQQPRRRKSASAKVAAAALLVSACTIESGANKAARELYNMGINLFKQRDTTQAVTTWRKASAMKDKEVYYRSLFNIGYVHLVDSTVADSAIANYKLVLQARSMDMDAKWNYELALRKKNKRGGGGSGGGSTSPTPTPSPTESRASQILNNAEREERNIQGGKDERSIPIMPPNGKDW